MKVAVVGAGPSGLAVALHLVARGVDVTVYERSSRVGGRVHTEQVGDYRVEHGPAGILSGAPATLEMLDLLGDDGPRVVPAGGSVSKRYVVRDGRVRLFPTDPSTLLGSALHVGELVDLWRERRNQTRSPLHETVADFVRRRFGASIASAFAQPMVLGVFGGDYEALEVESAFPTLHAMEREHGSVLRGVLAQLRARRERGEARPHLMTFAGGMGALPEAMARKLGTRIRLNAEVGLGELGADHLVLATSPHDAAELLPELELEAIPSTPIASVSLAYRRSEVSHALDGFGLLVPRVEAKATMGIIFMTSVFAAEPQAPRGEVLLRVLMGGPNDPNLLEGSDAQILDRAHREAASLLGVRSPPRFTHLVRWPHAIPQYVVGHAERRTRIEAAMIARNTTVAGTALRGIGVNDVLREAAAIAKKLAP